MTAMDEGQRRFEVKDGDRILRFNGVLIGEASSHKEGKPRWAHITIYRTEAGKYIVAGCGKTTVDGEHDKYWAQVCEQPEGVIQKLHMLDVDHSKYLPYVSRQALEQARSVDPVFADSYLVEDIA